MNKMIKKLLFLLLLVSFNAMADTQLNRMVVFGDSLSDTGNLASVVGPFPNPPYFNNRVTNGLVAMEIAAGKLNLVLEPSLHLIGPAQGSNYAVAGARASRAEPQDLLTQTTLFLANNPQGAPADALYVMFLGGNDIRHARDSDPISAQQIIADSVSTISSQIQLLTQAGARNWLVISAPDIGLIPETSMIAQAFGIPELPQIASELSQQFNTSLKKELNRIKDQYEIELVKFNLPKALEKILKKADKLGFSNTTEPCFSSQLGEFLPGCNFGLNFDQYIYFDEVHPTAKVHELVGYRIYNKIKDFFEAED